MPDANAYFNEAMRTLDRLPDNRTNQSRRIALIANQAPVMVLLFSFAEIYESLKHYEPVAISLNDAKLLGAFYACMGHCQWVFGELNQALSTLARFRQWEGAVDHLTSAIAMLTAIGAKSEVGLAYAASAQLDQQRGETERARNHYNRALDILNPLDMLSVPDKIRRQLDTLPAQ